MLSMMFKDTEFSPIDNNYKSTNTVGKERSMYATNKRTIAWCFKFKGYSITNFSYIPY